MQTKKIRIALIGDSTMQWIRPYRDHKQDYTYAELLLQNDTISVDLYITPGMMSHDALILTWQGLQAQFYDYYIFSVGINDCTPRSYPKFLAKMYNRILIANNFFHKLFFILYKTVTATKIQRLLSKFHISRSWVKVKTYEQNFQRIIEILTKETDAKIIFLTIPKTSARVEFILQNINHIIPRYNDVIKKMAANNIYILDINNLFETDYELYIPEGIHYSSAGHKIVFQQILSIITQQKLPS